MKKALFLDRDGTINVDTSYPHYPEPPRLTEQIVQILTKARELEYEVVVVTNQSGVGQGFFEIEDCLKFNDEINLRLEQEGLEPIRHWYICPHTEEDDCSCRKPQAGLLLRAAEELDIDLAESVMVGDKDSDRQAADAAGVGYRDVTQQWVSPQPTHSTLHRGYRSFSGVDIREVLEGTHVTHPNDTAVHDTDAIKHQEMIEYTRRNTLMGLNITEDGYEVYEYEGVTFHYPLHPVDEATEWTTTWEPNDTE